MVASVCDSMVAVAPAVAAVAVVLEVAVRPRGGGCGTFLVAARRRQMLDGGDAVAMTAV